MDLGRLPKIKARSAKRVGRGIGSGKGKTAGRGTKGQKARGKIPASNVGAGLVFYKKLPYRRGWSRRGAAAIRPPRPVPVGLSRLGCLTANSEVDLQTLIDNNIIDASSAKKRGVKLLGKGGLGVPLVVKLPASKSAKAMIEKAGGKIVV